MLKYIAFAKNPPASFTLTDWKFTLANDQRLTALNGLNDATDPNLSAVAKAGGKIIIWQGWADSAISPSGTVTYMIPAGYHITVAALNPGAPVGDGKGLNSSYPWVGSLLHGNELWCDVDGMSGHLPPATVLASAGVTGARS